MSSPKQISTRSNSNLNYQLDCFDYRNYQNQGAFQEGELYDLTQYHQSILKFTQQTRDASRYLSELLSPLQRSELCKLEAQLLLVSESLNPANSTEGTPISSPRHRSGESTPVGFFPHPLDDDLNAVSEKVKKQQQKSVTFQDNRPIHKSPDPPVSKSLTSPQRKEDKKKSDDKKDKEKERSKTRDKDKDNEKDKNEKDKNEKDKNERDKNERNKNDISREEKHKKSNSMPKEILMSPNSRRRKDKDQRKLKFEIAIRKAMETINQESSDCRTNNRDRLSNKEKDKEREKYRSRRLSSRSTSNPDIPGPILDEFAKMKKLEDEKRKSMAKIQSLTQQNWS